MSSNPQPARAVPEIRPEDVHHLGKKLPDLLPARMLNEFVYCPRLFFYEWVEGVFQESADTLDGQAKHTRVDRGPTAMPAAEDVGEEEIHSRSVTLSSERVGLTAKIDLIESDLDAAVDPEKVGSVRPVDYKRGKPRDVDGVPTPWPSDRVQIAAQAMVLRDNGYQCSEGMLYYAATKQRVRIEIDDALIAETEGLIAQARAAAMRTEIPEPLVDSPKCPRCSLVGICLPDETNALRTRALRFDDGRATQISLFDQPDAAAAVHVRPMVASRDELRPLYLNSQGFRVGKSGEVIQVKDGDELKQTVRMGEVSQVNLFGNVQLSTQAVQSLCTAEVPVCYFSQGGWFYGITSGLNARNVFLRHRQFMSAEHEGVALRLARKLVAGKIRNQRTLLQRNHIEPPEDALRQMKSLAEKAEHVDNLESLLGIEGSAARVYFSEFAGMLKPDEMDEKPHDNRSIQFRFDFTQRNRRPPRDPVNALLSLAYSILVKDLTITCYALGFDPYWGFYHQPRFGRPALALDLMEPFRPLIADSTVLTLINTRMVTPADFIQSGPAVALKANGRKGFFRGYEMRMDTLVTHPLFEYRVSYRRLLEIQARLLARFLNGEIDDYPVFVTR
jgi:CRISPR-associated protein Cas1